MKHGTESILHAESLRREAVGFGEWIRLLNASVLFPASIRSGWIVDDDNGVNNRTISTTSELYDQYLKSKSVEPDKNK